MTGEADARWQEFETLGEKEVRQRIASRFYGEEKLALARQWIEYRESLDSSAVRATTLALAREANELARSANDAALASNSIARDAASSAARSAKAAHISNIIAITALAAAILALIVSVMHMRQ